METEQQVAEEFSAPEIRERLRRAYRRLAREAQKRSNSQVTMPAAAPSPTAVEHGLPDEQKQTYTQLRLF